MDEILHHVEAMGNHCLLVFTGESTHSRVFLAGAGFRPSTVVAGNWQPTFSLLHPAIDRSITKRRIRSRLHQCGQGLHCLPRAKGGSEWSTNGCGSKPRKPLVNIESLQMDVHPPQIGVIGYAPWPNHNGKQFLVAFCSAAKSD